MFNIAEEEKEELLELINKIEQCEKDELKCAIKKAVELKKYIIAHKWHCDNKEFHQALKELLDIEFIKI